MSGTIHKLELDRRASGQDAAYAEMLERAHALVPKLRERAAITEEMRRLPPETERELHETGLFRILQPKRIGGSEFDYVALVDFADVIALADASVAWNLVNLASHHWMLGMFDKRAQDLIWNEDVNALIASSFIFPAGRARKVAGGYTLSGRWPFSSGVNSSTWNMLAGIVSSDDDADGVEYRIFLLKQDDYKIIDTWNSTGLKGTGSNDVEAKDVFVPDYMTLAVKDVAGGPTPGSVANPGALYALPGICAVRVRVVRSGSRQRTGLPGRLCRNRQASRFDLQSRQAGRFADDADQDRRSFCQDRCGADDHAPNLH